MLTNPLFQRLKLVAQMKANLAELLGVRRLVKRGAKVINGWFVRKGGGRHGAILTPGVGQLPGHLAACVAILLTATVFAATPPQVEGWKKAFPNVSPAEPASLRELARKAQWLVNQANPGNIGRTRSMLQELIDRELEVAGETIRSTTGSRATGSLRRDAEQKKAWIEHKFMPYLAKTPA